MKSKHAEPHLNFSVQCEYFGPHQSYYATDDTSTLIVSFLRAVTDDPVINSLLYCKMPGLH